MSLGKFPDFLLNFSGHEMNCVTHHSYRFKSFRLDVEDRRLLQDGVPVQLEPKVFDVLALLVENSGHLVEKNELLETVWADSFVEETNVARAVYTLRKTLGKDESGDKFIETVAKKGYRFVAEVEEVREMPAAKPSNGNGISSFAVQEFTVSEFASITTKTDLQIPSADNETRLIVKPKRKIRTVFFGIAFLSIIVLISFLYFNSRPASVPASDEIKSIAVLPLKSLDAGENYLGLGIADAVIRRLNQTGKLIVRPTSAVRRYLNEETDALAAGRELNADAVLDGNVQRNGDRLRVSVNLLRVSDGVSLWTDNFDMRTADIFTIQDTVAQQVASRLRLQLDTAQQARFNKRFTSNAIANEYYIKGVYSFDQRGYGDDAKPQMEATIVLFKKAIEADPDYALAHAQLANAYIWKAIFIEEQAEWAERAKEEINRADALDPQLAETHVARHWLFVSAYEGWQSEAAVRELLLAQQINPNVGHVELGGLYYHLGLEELGDRAYQRAVEIDPTSENIKYQIYAHYILVRKYDEWLDAYQKSNPNAPNMLWYFMGKGRLDEAQKALDEFSAKNPKAVLGFTNAFLAALKGDFRPAETEIPLILRKANPQNYTYHHLTYNIACIYALAGKSDEAVKWLRKTAAEGFPSYTLFERDAYLNRIRQAPEFIRFMEEMKVQNERYKSEFE